MIELLPARRRAEEFARALDGQEESVHPRLEPLLAAARGLAAVPVAEPREDFRESLRTRLVEAAAVELRAARGPAEAGTPVDETATPARPAVVDDVYAARRRRRLVAIATGFVLVGGGTGVAAASQQALPGDMLYPIKRTLESAEVTFADGADGVGRALLERASTRLDEAQALSTEESFTETDLAAVDTALSDFVADASGGGRSLLDAYAEGGDPADLTAIRDFTTTSHGELRDLAASLPRESRPALQEAIETVRTLDNETIRACPDCTSELPALPTPGLQPVLATLPQLDIDATPHLRGVPPLDTRAFGDGPDDRQRPTERTSERHRDADSERHRGAGSERHRGPGSGTAAPTLPDVDLQGPRLEQPAGGHDGRTAPPDSADEATGEPLVDLDDVLGDDAPRPSQRPRTTDGPGLGDVTEPLSDGTKKLTGSPSDDTKKLTGSLSDSTKKLTEPLSDGTKKLTEPPSDSTKKLTDSVQDSAEDVIDDLP